VEKNKEGIYKPMAVVELCGLSLGMTGMKLQEPTYDNIVQAIKMCNGE
jgi:hypothetical protein